MCLFIGKDLQLWILKICTWKKDNEKSCINEKKKSKKI
jgi:hypothetical protein